MDDSTTIRKEILLGLPLAIGAFIGDKCHGPLSNIFSYNNNVWSAMIGMGATAVGIVIAFRAARACSNLMFSDATLQNEPELIDVSVTQSTQVESR